MRCERRVSFLAHVSSGHGIAEVPINVSRTPLTKLGSRRGTEAGIGFGRQTGMIARLLQLLATGVFAVALCAVFALIRLLALVQPRRL